MSTYLGWRWLAEHLGVAPVQPFAVESRLGTRRKTVITGHLRIETYPAAAQPEATVPAHLTFALKHEAIHPEFLARIFDTVPAVLLEDWIRGEPTGAYARRTGFLYEWITGRRLDVPDTPSGNYIEALEPEKYVVATRPANVPRWRVRDNMPGTPAFCPLILRSDTVRMAEDYDCARALQDLELAFGADVLLRSAVWLTIKESRASFLIEHEEKKIDRVRRFAAAMESRCGADGEPLAADALNKLQAAILGPATRYGMRLSPIFVGHSSGYLDQVDYIAPHWDQVQPLLEGLQACLRRTGGVPSILRAAIASFGFVFIHPMSDGNGRISRFLVNDVLRRDGAVPAPFILPISAAISNSAHERAAYDRALEAYSKPLMRQYADRYRFGAMAEYQDGVRSNFHFDAYDAATPVWRYPDLTAQVAYLGHVVRITIEQEMRREALFLRDLERARAGVKEHLEGPNADIDHIIRSVRENGWTVSNKLRKTFPMLDDQTLANSIIHAIRAVLEAPAAKELSGE